MASFKWRKVWGCLFMCVVLLSVWKIGSVEGNDGNNESGSHGHVSSRLNSAIQSSQTTLHDSMTKISQGFNSLSGSVSGNFSKTKPVKDLQEFATPPNVNPWFGITLDNQRCKITPTDFPQYADFYSIVCPVGVDRVHATFAKSEKGDVCEVGERRCGDSPGYRLDSLYLYTKKDSPSFQHVKVCAKKQLVKEYMQSAEKQSSLKSWSRMLSSSDSLLKDGIYPPPLNSLYNTAKIKEVDRNPPEGCQVLTLYSAQELPQTPLLSNIYFSKESSSMKPPFSPSTDKYKIGLYAYEDTVISAASIEGYFVSFEEPKVGRYGVERNGFRKYQCIPSYMSGSSEMLTIFVSSADGKVHKKYEVEVSCVPSTNPNLQYIQVLDRKSDFLANSFSPFEPSYSVLAPTTLRKVVLKVQGENTAETEIYVNGKYRGKGSVETSITVSRDDPTSIVVEGRLPALNPGRPTALKKGYHILIEPKGDGSNLLEELSAVGGVLSPAFSPTVKSYTVELVGQKFVGFKFGKRNSDSEIRVNDILIEEGVLTPTSGLFYLYPGQNKSITVKVSETGHLMNGKNAPHAVELEYTIEVQRSADGALVGNHENLSHLAKLTTYGNVILNSSSQAAFMGAVKLFNLVSFTGSVPNNDEQWRSFAENFDYVSLQQIVPKISLKNGKDTWLVQTDSDHNLYVNPLLHESIGTTDVEKRGKIQQSSGLKEMRRLREKQKVDALKRNPKETLYMKKIYEQNRIIIKAFSGIHNYSDLFMMAFVIYTILWFTYLRGDSLFTLRKDYPYLLNPYVFWAFILDYGLFSITQSCVNLLYMDKSLYITLNESSYPVWMIFVLSSVLLLAYPIFFVLSTGFLLSRLRKDVVYSDVLGRYTDSVCTQIRAKKKFFSKIPILSDIFTFNVSEAVPVGSPSIETLDQFQQNEAKLRFVPTNIEDINLRHDMLLKDTNTDSFFGRICNSQNAAKYCLLNDDKDIYEPCDGEHEDVELEDTFDSKNADQLEDSKLIRLANSGTNESPVESEVDNNLFHLNKNGDEVEVALNDRDFMDYRYNIANMKTCHQSAVVGYNRFSIKNAYSSYINVNLEIQLKHIESLLHMVRRFTCWVPIDHLEFKNCDRAAYLLRFSYHNRFSSFFLDRVLTLLLLFGSTSLSQISSSLALFLLVLGFGLLSVTYLPSAVSGGLIKYDQYVRARDRNERLEGVVNGSPELEAKYSSLRKLRSEYNKSKFEQMYYDVVMESYNTIREHKLFKNKYYFILREILLGPVTVELLKGFIILPVYFANRASEDGGHPHLLRMSVLSTLAIFSILSLPQMGKTIQKAKTLAESVLHMMFFAILTFLQLVPEYRHYINKWKFYTHATYMFLLQKLSFGTYYRNKAVSFKYENTKSLFGLKYKSKVSSVKLVVPDLGLHMPGSAEVARSNVHTYVKDKRTSLYKTTYTYGPLSLKNNFSNVSSVSYMPFVFDYNCFLEARTCDVSRLVATIQVYNHEGYRYDSSLSSYFRHTDEDDSYISLYTNPDYVSDIGSIFLRPGQQNHSVYFDSVAKTICISGPGIKPDSSYAVSSVHKSEDPDIYEDLFPSKFNENVHVGISAEGPSRTTLESLCASSGKLSIPLTQHESTPNLYEKIRVEGSDEVLEIDPLLVLCTFEAKSRNLILRHQKLYRNHKYQITYTNLKNNNGVEGCGKSTSTGILAIPATNGVPNLYSCVLLVTDQWHQTFEIDPALTDTYQCVMSKPNMFDKNFVSQKLGHTVEAVKQTFKDLAVQSFFPSSEEGDSYDPSLGEEWVPCTVTQCLDPGDGVFRVNPNISYMLRKLEGDMCETRAKMFDINSTLDGLQHNVFEVFTEEQFVHFYKKHNLPVVYESRWINPLTESGHPLLRNHGTDLGVLEHKLRKLTLKRFEKKMHLIETSTERYRVYSELCNDSELYRATQALDNAEWNNFDRELIVDLREVVRTRLGAYRASVPDLVYPIDISSSVISTRPRMEEQYKEWNEQIERWLKFEVGASEEAFVNNGMTRLKYTTSHIMQKVSEVFEEREDHVGSQFRSILHFLTPSLVPCGAQSVWKPDPLCAQAGHVKCYRMVKGAEMALPSWLPCIVKLNATSVKIILAENSLASEQICSTNVVREMTGWIVPLSSLDLFNMETIDHLAYDDSQLGLSAHRLMLTFAGSNNASQAVFNLMTGEETNLLNFEGETYSIKVSDNDRLTLRVGANNQFKWQSVAYGTRMISDTRVQKANDRWANDYSHATKLNIFGKGRINEGKDCLSEPSFPEEKTDKIQQNLDKYPSPRQLASLVSDPLVMKVEMVETPRLSKNPGTIVQLKPLLAAKLNKNREQKFYAKLDQGEAQYLGKYLGDFLNNQYHGFGQIYDEQNRLRYEGEFVHGVRWGRGVMNFFHEGVLCCYEGMFVSDCMHDANAQISVVDEDVRGKVRVGEILKTHALQYRNLSVLQPQFAQNLPEKPVESKNMSRETKILLIVSNLPLNTRFDEAIPEWDPNELNAMLPFATGWQEETDTIFKDGISAECTMLCDGSIFCGKTVHFHPSGLGTLVTEKFVFRGAITHDMPDEKHVFCALNGPDNQLQILNSENIVVETYKGSMQGNKPEGQGQIRNAAYEITGNFAKGFLEGQDTSILFKDHKAIFKSYQGATLQGSFEGIGNLTFQDDTVFEGIFKQGLRQGKGTLRHPTRGLIYNGSWQRDKPEGHTRLELGGVHYVGDMSEGLREGYGRVFSSSKAVLYEGYFRGDKPNGSGIMHMPSGTFEGNFVDGKFHGKGRFTFEEKTAGRPKGYDGEWVQGVPQGIGAYRDDQGEHKVYTWAQGQITEESRAKYKAKQLAQPIKPVPVDCGSVDDAYWGSRCKAIASNVKPMLEGVRLAYEKWIAEPFQIVNSSSEPSPALLALLSKEDSE